jgi:AhpD family alkylhydroperoxidase
MKQRLNPFKAVPELMQAMLAFFEQIESSGIDEFLVELIKIRASQVNGCAYGIYAHTAEALALGELEERLYLLDAWPDSPLYSHSERAALAWTEALTLISRTHAPDAAFEELRRHFSEIEVVQLTLVIAAINIWNRVAIGFRLIHSAKPTYTPLLPGVLSDEARTPASICAQDRRDRRQRPHPTEAIEQASAAKP